MLWHEMLLTVKKMYTPCSVYDIPLAIISNHSPLSHTTTTKNAKQIQEFDNKFIEVINF